MLLYVGTSVCGSKSKEALIATWVLVQIYTQSSFLCLYVLAYFSIYFIKRFIKYIRERPFNLKGGVMFFFLKNILIPNVAEKNILILVEETNNNLIRVFVI